MMKSKLRSIPRTWIYNLFDFLFHVLLPCPLNRLLLPGCLLFLSVFILYSSTAFAVIYIDIDSPSVRKFKIAVPDFTDRSYDARHHDLSYRLSGVIKNDLYLSGFFQPMDKGAFLQGGKAADSMGSINFKDWSVIGADLLLKGAYQCVGNSLTVDMRLYDVFWARQIVAKRGLGTITSYRYLMHRLGNEIIKKLTGHPGMFDTKIAFVSNGTGHKEIYISDYDGYNVRRLTYDKSIDLFPRLSPNGKRIMYNSYKDGGPMLYIRDLAFNVSRRISSRPGLNIGAAWMPDGKKAALTMSNNGNVDIFLIDLNGRILRRLTNYWGIDVSPSFSPDGKKMAFVSNRSGSPQIYVLDLTNNTTKRVTFNGHYNTAPAWSSRNQIAFMSFNNGVFDICSIDEDGGHFKKLTCDQGKNEDPCWSPDGRYIMFSSNRTGHYHIYIMTANGRNQTQITTMKGDQTSPSWAPW